MNFDFEKNLEMDVFDLFRKRINEVETFLKSTQHEEVCICDEVFKTEGKRKYIKINELSHKKGVYFFYKEKADIIDYLYVGECHVVNEKWDITYRLKQHFQKSQKSGLLYRIMDDKPINISEKIDRINSQQFDEGAKKKQRSEEIKKAEKKAINSLKGVKIGYFDLSDKDEAFILLTESILITNCDSKYNKK
ncbi:MAG: hypothetical protein Q3980_14805 [Turicibacter sp.]|nr:hypothetical protein [Turicibacter sp.]